MTPVKKVSKKATKKVAKKPVAPKKVKKVAAKKVEPKKAKPKAAKKPAVKKTVAQKVSAPKVKKAGSEYCFIVQDGTKISDIKEMAMILDALEDHIFYHHVNNERNDFANWVEDVFSEKELAEELRAIMDKLNTQRIVLKYLVRKHI